MTFLTSVASVCFVACHGGPADHFATLAQEASKDASIEIFATGPALKKFQERGIQVQSFSLEKLSSSDEDLLAEEIAKACSTAFVVITDLGHAFDIKVQEALARLSPRVKRLAYYDNPESYVPGGYSSVAAKVMKAAHGVIFANSNLAKEPVFEEPGKQIALRKKEKIGLGYYPLEQAEKIAKRREIEKSSKRTEFLAKHFLQDTKQKVMVYFGGNNEEYFSKAFPAFLSFLEKEDFSNSVFVLQQHPGAKGSNIDANYLKEWMNKHPKAPKVIVSDFNSDEAQVLGDAALYYQTSMGPQFALAGIPTIQVGHETFEDILVRNHLSPSATDRDSFKLALDAVQLQKPVSKEVIFKGLGIRADCFEIFKQAVLPQQEFSWNNYFSNRNWTLCKAMEKILRFPLRRLYAEV